MAHIELEIEGQAQKYEYEESIQGEVVYDINTNEVGIVTEANRKIFELEIEWMDAFTPHMACFMKQEEDEAIEANRKYLALEH